MAELDGSQDFTGDPQGRRREWYRYYSQKRISHQLLQVQLLADLAVDRVLEVGPNLGLVSMLLDNAGFQVTTLDLLPAQYENARISHI